MLSLTVFYKRADRWTHVLLEETCFVANSSIQVPYNTWAVVSFRLLFGRVARDDGLLKSCIVLWSNFWVVLLHGKASALQVWEYENPGNAHALSIYTTDSGNTTNPK